MVCWKHPFAKHPSSYTDVSTQPCVHVYSSTPSVVKQSWLNVSDMFAEWLTLEWWISPYSQHRWFPVTSAFLWALVTQSSPWIQHLVMEETETKNSYALQLHISYAFSSYSVSNDWMHQMVMCLYMLAFSQLAMWCVTLSANSNINTLDMSVLGSYRQDLGNQLLMFIQHSSAF